MEVLISLTIITIMVTVIAGALKLGISAWERGEADMEASQRQRAVLGLIANQLSTIMAPGRKPYSTNPLALRGNSGMIEYVSRRPILLKGRESLITARYEVVDALDNALELNYSEIPYVAAENPEHSAEVEERQQDRVLYEKFHRIGFEYLGQTVNGGVEDQRSPTTLETPELPWQEEWDPAVEKDYPRAVRITIVPHATDSPLRVIVAIHSG